MIRWTKLLLIIILSTSLLEGQDVFDLENSRRFANYLFESGQYDLAADELERVVFLDSNDSLSILHLLQSYRFSKQHDIGVKRAFELFPETQKLNLEFFRELFLLNIYSGKYERGKALIDENQNLPMDKKDRLQLSVMMLQKDWKSAEEFLQDSQEGDHLKSLSILLAERNELKYKSPFLASGLSLLIPGMGKFYTGDWQDGLIALLFVGTNAYQAYRGFNRDGVKSAYGWIFGSIGAGFWLGNVYGSYRSAGKYNERIENAYYDRVSDTIFTDL